jgi:hypothetical protein
MMTSGRDDRAATTSHTDKAGHNQRRSRTSRTPAPHSAFHNAPGVAVGREQPSSRIAPAALMRPVDMAFFVAEHDDHHLATIHELLDQA